jgi:hypothetical protein
MTYFFSAMVAVVFTEIGLCDDIYYDEYNRQAPHNETDICSALKSSSILKSKSTSRLLGEPKWKSVREHTLHC